MDSSGLFRVQIPLSSKTVSLPNRFAFPLASFPLFFSLVLACLRLFPQPLILFSSLKSSCVKKTAYIVPLAPVSVQSSCPFFTAVFAMSPVLIFPQMAWHPKIRFPLPGSQSSSLLFLPGAIFPLSKAALLCLFTLLFTKYALKISGRTPRLLKQSLAFIHSM